MEKIAAWDEKWCASRWLVGGTNRQTDCIGASLDVPAWRPTAARDEAFAGALT
jgi:hypothetical protein